MTAAVAIVVVVLLLVVAVVAGSLRVIRPGERGLVFRLGRVLPGVREPGRTLIVPVVDRLRRVRVETQATEALPQEMMTRDNVVMRVGAVIHMRITDPVAAILGVADPWAAVSQFAATSLHSFIGHCDFDELAATRRETINAQLREVMAEPVGEWGVRIEQVELVTPQAHAA